MVHTQGLVLEAFVFELVCLSRQEMELFGQNCDTWQTRGLPLLTTGGTCGTRQALAFSDEHRESALAVLAKHILSRQESALNRSVLEQESDFQARQEHAGRKPLGTESSLYPLLRWKKKKKKARSI